MKFPRSLFAILAPALLCCSGCSTVTLGYNHADWLLRYRIAGYTSFNVRQNETIHLEVDNYMRWHRRNALPEYTVFLQQLHASVNQHRALTAEDIMRLRAESNRLYRLTMSPAIRPAARILGTLDGRQTEELRKTLADRNRKQREETLFENERENLARRAERHIDFVKNLVGSLSDEQEAAITEMSLHIPFATGDYIGQREAKQARLISLLHNRADEDRIAALFQQWIDTPESGRTPQQQQAIAAYESAMNEMTARIFALLTPRQKNHLSKKIMSYIADFQKINSAVEPVRATD